MIYFKDRDFPEVKTSNSDIVAHIPDPKQLKRVVDDYNAVERKYCDASRQVKRLLQALKDIRDEQIYSGDPFVPQKQHENVLTLSMRNTALEAIENYEHDAKECGAV